MTNKYVQGLVAIAATVLMASTASAVNLLANPGFENPQAGGAEYFGAPGWTDFGGNTFTIKGQPPIGPAGAHGGTQVLKMFGFSGVYQQFAASAGQTWNADAWMLNDTADLMSAGQVAAINIEWINAANVNVGTVFGGTISGLTPSNVWQNLTASGVAVAGTAFARVVLITGDFAGPGGGAPRFDDASFSVVPVPAAVWLFGSALGLLGVARRKVLA
jgi:hypothetical protein